jgi:hypothetical protein
MPHLTISKAIPPTSLWVAAAPDCLVRAGYKVEDRPPVTAVAVPIEKKNGLWYFSLGENQYKAIPTKQDLTPQRMPVLPLPPVNSPGPSGQFSKHIAFEWPTAHTATQQRPYLLLLLHTQIFTDEADFSPQSRRQPDKESMCINTIQTLVIGFFTRLHNGHISHESISHGLYPGN